MHPSCFYPDSVVSYRSICTASNGLCALYQSQSNHTAVSEAQGGKETRLAEVAEEASKPSSVCEGSWTAEPGLILLSALSLDNSDLIACTVITKDGGMVQRFLAVDIYQMSLVEPDVSRLGWGVVKFAGLLQVRV